MALRLNRLLDADGRALRARVSAVRGPG
jgi:hypothetical protein